MSYFASDFGLVFEVRGFSRCSSLLPSALPLILEKHLTNVTKLTRQITISEASSFKPSLAKVAGQMKWVLNE